ncbi:unnamed protein product [Scytosiphon promiscuus]
MGQELELGASEVISYLFRHCAEVVAREATAGEAREGGGATTTAAAAGGAGATATTSCVVASVPSFFSLRQRRAVLDAASIAGVPMPLVVDQGTAVALAYGVLGGGATLSAGPPLKVTVASFTEAGVQILGRGCAKRGGTAAAEACVYDRICRTARQGIAVEGRPRAEFRLAKALTSAIKTLSANQEARLSVECIDGDKDLSVMLTREEVEEACSGVAAGVSKACREALRAAGMGAKDVDAVELLGGGSYIPLLRRSVESAFGRERVRRTMSSSESVARGCALAAARHSSVFKLRPYRVVDSLSRELRLVWPTISTSGGDSSSPSPSRNGGKRAARGSEDGQGTAEEGRTGVVDVPLGAAIPWSTAVTIDLGSERTRGQEKKRGKLKTHAYEAFPHRLKTRAERILIRTVQQRDPKSGSSESEREGERGAHTIRQAFSPGTGGAHLKRPFFVPDECACVHCRWNQRVLLPWSPFRQVCDISRRLPCLAPPPTKVLSALVADAQGCPRIERFPLLLLSLGARSLSFAIRVVKTGVRRRSNGVQETAAAESGSGQAHGAKIQAEDRSPEQQEESQRQDSENEKGSKDKEAGDERGGGGGEDGAGEARPKAAKIVKVPRLVTRRRSRLVRVKQTYSGMLEGAELEAARDRERALRAQDEAVRSANEARNTLENLIYSTRSSLEPGDGYLSPFVSPSEASGILAFLEETEEWLYGAMSGGDSGGAASPEEEVEEFERRTSSLRHRLSDPQGRRRSRVGLVNSLDEADAAVERGEAQLREAAAQGSLTISQLQQGNAELEDARKFVEGTRKKLEDSSSGGEYGSFSGRLPSQEAEVRKKTENLRKMLTFARKEES